MINSMYFSEDGSVNTKVALSEWKKILEAGRGVLWVDIHDEPLDSCRNVLKDIFGFHPLVIEDALEDSHSPKINEWEGYLYVVIHSAIPETEIGFRDDTLEIDVFLGKNFILTYHKDRITSIHELWSVISQDQRVIQKGPSYILYRFGDRLVNEFLGIVDAIDEEIDDFEDTIFSNPGQLILEEIFSRKRYLLHLRRIMLYQREVYNKLARDDFKEIHPENRIYFRDIYDHFVRIHDLIESLREMISGTLDIYLSMINNQMSQVMKTLTLFTALFMPLSFLTGFFGMNFFSPQAGFEDWTGFIVFPILLLTFILLPLFMFLWMRKRKWF